MAKLTLLEMTQDILESMDSDEVNSIADTVESNQVAKGIITTYYELFAGLSKPSREGLIKLDSLSNPLLPNYMAIPSNVKSIKWIRYNGKLIEYAEPELFMTWSFDRSNNDPDSIVKVLDPQAAVDIWIFNNEDPTYWTTFDNNYIVFNGYDSNFDSTLMQSKTTCWGQIDPVFEFKDDAYAPYLNGDDYPGLLAEAKSYCFINYKQVSNNKEEQKSKRQRVRHQNDEWRANQREPYNRTPNYARRGRGYSGRSTRVYT